MTAPVWLRMLQPVYAPDNVPILGHFARSTLLFFLREKKKAQLMVALTAETRIKGEMPQLFLSSALLYTPQNGQI